MITLEELAYTGIASDAYNALRDSSEQVKLKFTLHKWMAAWSNHDYINREQSDLDGIIDGADRGFSAKSSPIGIVRAFQEYPTNIILADFLPVEDDNNFSYLNYWNIQIVATDAMPYVQPSVAWNPDDSRFYIAYLNTSNIIKLSSTDDGATWTTPVDFISGFSPLWDGTKSIALVAKPMTVYINRDDNKVSHLYGITQLPDGMRGPAGLYDLKILWPSLLNGFDAEWRYKDIKTLPDRALSESWGGVNINSQIEHVLVLSGEGPPSYIYKTNPLTGTAYKSVQKSGGLNSIIVNPVGTMNRLQPSCSYQYPIDVIDLQSSHNNRSTAHVSGGNTFLDYYSTNARLYATAIGWDGDLLDDAGSNATQAIFWYSSSDGRYWSQSEMVLRLPEIHSGTDFIGWAQNASLLKCGKIIYLLTKGTTHRQQAGSRFGDDTSLSMEVDITAFMTSYQSSFQDMRQTTIQFTDPNLDVFTDRLEAGAATWTLVTEAISNTGTIIRIATEIVDSIQLDQTAQGNIITLSCRDMTSLMTDNSEADQSIQWDNQTVGIDTFVDVNGTANTGLAHTAVQTGSFGTGLSSEVTAVTPSSALHVKSKYGESIAFNTFKDHVVDGSVTVRLRLPSPVALGRGAGTPTPTSVNSPTYGGLVFRAVDKDNMYYVVYDYWTDHVQLWQRSASLNTLLHSYDMGIIGTNLRAYWDTWDDIRMPLRVDFQGALIKAFAPFRTITDIGMYGFDASEELEKIFEYRLHGSTHTQATFFSGYVGMIGCGFSDEDTGGAGGGGGGIDPGVPYDPCTDGADFLSSWTLVTGTSASAPSGAPSGVTGGFQVALTGSDGSIDTFEGDANFIIDIPGATPRIHMDMDTYRDLSTTYGGYIRSGRMELRNADDDSLITYGVLGLTGSPGVDWVNTTQSILSSGLTRVKIRIHVIETVPTGTTIIPFMVTNVKVCLSS